MDCERKFICERKASNGTLATQPIRMISATDITAPTAILAIIFPWPIVRLASYEGTIQSLSPRFSSMINGTTEKNHRKRILRVRARAYTLEPREDSLSIVVVLVATVKHVEKL